MQKTINMKKFNLRELYLLQEAIRTQRDQTVAEIEAAQDAGRMPIFTPRYITMEHNDLLEKVREHSTKKAQGL